MNKDDYIIIILIMILIFSLGNIITKRNELTKICEKNNLQVHEFYNVDFFIIGFDSVTCKKLDKNGIYHYYNFNINGNQYE